MGAGVTWNVTLAVVSTITVEAYGVTEEEAAQEAVKEHGGQVIKVWRDWEGDPNSE